MHSGSISIPLKVENTHGIINLSGHTSDLINEKIIIIFGGIVREEIKEYISNYLFGFNLVTYEIKILKEEGEIPSPRYYHSSTCINLNQIALIGGANDEKKIENKPRAIPDSDLYLLDCSNLALSIWKKVEVIGKLPPKRYGHSISFLKPLLILFGGKNYSEILNDLWTLNINSKNEISWVSADIANMKTLPEPRFMHTSHIIDRNLIIVGGRNEYEDCSLSTFIINLWKKDDFKVLDSINIFNHSSCVAFNKIIVYGGNFNSSEIIDSFKISILNMDPFLARKKNSFTTIDSLSMKGVQQLYCSQISSDIRKSERPRGNNLIEGIYDIKHLKNLETNSRPECKDFEVQIKLSKSNELNIEEPPIEDLVISQLLIKSKIKQWNRYETFCLHSSIIQQLISKALYLVASQPIILDIRIPVKVFGDVHGQFHDLIKFFNRWKSPLEDHECVDYLFLGDYVDRGHFSLEIICLLMALKIKYPYQIHIIRGNHEDMGVNHTYGFLRECEIRLREDCESPSSIYRKLNKFFEYLPLCAVIEKKILCVHGGIGATFRDLNSIKNIKRPLKINPYPITFEEHMIIDILWSDPTDDNSIQGIHPNGRDQTDSGAIVRFGPDIIKEFLEKNRLKYIFRAHECVNNGIEKFADGKFFTIFSATNYCGRHNNNGGMIFISKQKQLTFHIIKPNDRSPDKDSLKENMNQNQSQNQKDQKDQKDQNRFKENEFIQLIDI